MSLSLKVVSDTVTPELKRLLQEAKRPRALVAAGIRAVYKHLRKHFRDLEKKNPNKLKGGRQHFWLQMMRATNTPVITDTHGVVTVSDPRYAMKISGGTIYAKRAKMLTIPICAEAYGRAASVLEQELGIKLRIIGSGGRGVLAHVVNGQVVKIYYVLKKFVVLPPFPGAMPGLDKMSAEAMQAVRSAAQRQLNPGGARV